MSPFGHKMHRACLEKDILGTVEGKRRQSRPARVWADDTTESLGCTLAAAVQEAQDRMECWHLIRTTPVLLGTL